VEGRHGCHDWYGAHPTRAVTDLVGPDSGAFRVFGGGTWISGAHHCRTACRDRLDPCDLHYDMGFHLARP